MLEKVVAHSCHLKYGTDSDTVESCWVRVPELWGVRRGGEGLDCLDLKDSALSLAGPGVWGVRWGCFGFGVWETPPVFV